MTQDEFNDEVSKQIASLHAENKALKKQLGAIDGAEEVLNTLVVQTERSQSAHKLMMAERKTMAEEAIKNREDLKAEVESAFTRLENSKKLAKSQMQLTYDAAAESNAALEQIRALHGEVSTMGGSLIERQDNVIRNIDERQSNLDRLAGNQYLEELHRTDSNRRSNAEISNEIQRQMRLMNPTAFAEPEQQVEG